MPQLAQMRTLTSDTDRGRVDAKGVCKAGGEDGCVSVEERFHVHLQGHTDADHGQLLHLYRGGPLHHHPQLERLHVPVVGSRRLGDVHRGLCRQDLLLPSHFHLERLGNVVPTPVSRLQPASWDATDTATMTGTLQVCVDRVQVVHPQCRATHARYRTWFVTQRAGGDTLDLDDNSLLWAIARQAELLLLWGVASVENSVGPTILDNGAKTTQAQQ